jgi:bla regulator protein blaR1
MRQTEQNVKNTLHQNLDKASYDGIFSKIWASHLSKSGSHFKYSKFALMPMVIIITLLALCTVGYAGLSRLTDNVDLPFIDDPQVIGKWEVVDFVDKINDFDSESKSYEEKLYLSNLVFIKSGQMLDSFGNGNLFYSGSTWTNGVIINPEIQIASKYEIKEINGNKYMFMEWKSGDYIIRFMKPNYYVLKQVDTDDYSNFAPTRIEDNIEYEFANSPEMLGLWKSVDFVDKMDDYEPGKHQYEDSLFVKELNILEDGKLSFKFMDDTTSTTVSSWTGGLILNHKEKTASKCTIKEIDGETYMFSEWKSGDYIYRGMKPKYYVFKKTE